MMLPLNDTDCMVLVKVPSIFSAILFSANLQGLKKWISTISPYAMFLNEFLLSQWWRHLGDRGLYSWIFECKRLSKNAGGIALTCSSAQETLKTYLEVAVNHPPDVITDWLKSHLKVQYKLKREIPRQFTFQDLEDLLEGIWLNIRGAEIYRFHTV